jgi:hypothetical protein
LADRVHDDTVANWIQKSRARRLRGLTFELRG